MQENRANVSSSSKGHAFALNAVTRSLMFMLVFCFAGCAAGSCLSYGHSCWGAHGKRSGQHNYPAGGNRPENDERPAIPGGSGNEAAGQSLQDRWVLSRLVTRQLSAPAGAQEFQENWYNSNKGRGHSRSWDSNDVGVSSPVESVKALRRDEVEAENDDDDEEEDEEEEEEIRDEEVVVPRVMSRETREQVLESRDISDDDELVLLPPSNSRFKPIGQSHRLRLFKILNGSAGKLK